VARQVADAAGGTLAGAVTFAGVSGYGERPGSDVVSVNYFGTVHLLELLAPLLAVDGAAAAVAIGSNSSTVTPRIPAALVDACLAGDEPAARSEADEVGGRLAYAASKLAVARWVRRHAPTSEWVGRGINLNVVVPGHVDTPMTQAIRADDVGRVALGRERLPVGRPGSPEEIAAFVAFLLGDGGRFFVGSALYLDGGTDAVVRADDWPSSRP
jgi:NAD(P)-dependent dehydrogenase (short-subunit alcohol dehydrogenase family)